MNIKVAIVLVLLILLVVLSPKKQSYQIDIPDINMDEEIKRINNGPSGKLGWNQYAPLDYKKSTHQFIVWHAMKVLKNGGYDDVYEWLFRYWAQIGKGLWDGDFLNPWYNGGTTSSDIRPAYNQGFKSHFYDSYTGTNLLGDTTMTGSTYTMYNCTRAGQVFEKIKDKKDVVKNAPEVFYQLGLALHYFTDLSQPCHAHNFGALNWPQKLHTFVEVYAQNFIREYDFDFTCTDKDKCFKVMPLADIINKQTEESVRVYEYPLGDKGDCKWFALGEETTYGPYVNREKMYSIGGTCFGPTGIVESCSSAYSPISYPYLKSCWEKEWGQKVTGWSIPIKDVITPMVKKQLISGVHYTAKFLLSWFYEYGKGKASIAKHEVTVIPDKKFPSLDNPPKSCEMDNQCYWNRLIDDCDCVFEGCDKSKCSAVPGSIVQGLGERYGTCVCTDKTKKTCEDHSQCDKAFKPTGAANYPWVDDDYLDQCQSMAYGVTSTGCQYNKFSKLCDCKK